MNQDRRRLHHPARHDSERGELREIVELLHEIADDLHPSHTFPHPGALTVSVVTAPERPTMSKVIVTFPVTLVALAATAAPYAKTTVTLTDAAGGVQTADAGPIPMSDGTTAVGVSFSTVTAPGAGTLSAQAFDTTGAALGTPSTGSFTIGASGPTFPQPGTLSVTVA